MYYVAGANGRKVNRPNDDVAGDTGGRRCEFVFECLLELLEDAVGERNRRRCDCEFVFECLLELLEDALGEDEEHHCHRH